MPDLASVLRTSTTAESALAKKVVCDCGLKIAEGSKNF
jgi:hypothetical protein